jgi:hypothetical protein
MASAVSIVLAALLAADWLWWRRADRLARRWRHALAWPLFLGLFMGGQIALALWTLGGGVPRASPSAARPSP